MATDPLGRYLYVVNQGSDNVSVFSIVSGTGILTAVGSPVSTGVGSGPRAVTVEPSGRFAYVVYATTNHQVSRFDITQTNRCVAATGVPLSLAPTAAPRAIVVDSTGRFLYVANSGTNTVSAYPIAAGGRLVDRARRLAIFCHRYWACFVVCRPSRSVSLRRQQDLEQCVGFHHRSGDRRAFATLASFRHVPQSIAVDLSGRFAYVANASGTVTAFAINQTTGVLSSVAGSPFAAGVNPSAITTVGRF